MSPQGFHWWRYQTHYPGQKRSGPKVAPNDQDCERFTHNRLSRTFLASYINAGIDLYVVQAPESLEILCSGFDSRFPQAHPPRRARIVDGKNLEFSMSKSEGRTTHVRTASTNQ